VFVSTVPIYSYFIYSILCILNISLSYRYLPGSDGALQLLCEVKLLCSVRSDGRSSATLKWTDALSVI
jgi:hypothetical protein